MIIQALAVYKVLLNHVWGYNTSTVIELRSADGSTENRNLRSLRRLIGSIDLSIYPIEHAKMKI